MISQSKPVPVSLRILEKDYVVACPEEERETLIASAQFFNKKVQEVREGGKVVSNERIAVVSALNIIHEYFQQQQQQADDIRLVNRQISHLQDKIEQTLNEVKDIIPI
jgi:cell division protein ZapA